MKKKNKKRQRKGGITRPHHHGRLLRIPELLAPAGSKDAFFAALEAGADAVYVGAGSLNARAYGSRFSLEQITSMCQEARQRGKRLYVALNSLVKEKELAEAMELLAGLEAASVHAVILQDLGLARLCRQMLPDLELHASTLCGIHNASGLKMAASFGFKRVVLARELTLQEISRLARANVVETEVFIHGALCFSVSGLCLFSSFHGGKSSTRGRCVQPCRRRYRWNGREGAFFSMSDLDTLDLLPRLVTTGVDTLKIEGRLKGADYVYAVTRAYRMALDQLSNAPTQDRAAADWKKGWQEVAEEARSILEGAGGRHVTQGYLASSRPKGVISPGRAAASGQYVGRVVEIQQREDGAKEVFRLEVEPPKKRDTERILHNGDRLRLVWPERDGQETLELISKRRGKGTLTIEACRPSGRGGPLARVLQGRLDRQGPLLFKTACAWFSDRMQEHRLPTPRNMDAIREAQKAARAWLTEHHVGIGVGGATTNGNRRQRTPRGQECEHGTSSAKGHVRKPGGYELWVKVASISQAKRLLSRRNKTISSILVPITPSTLKEARGRLPKDLGREEVIWSLPPLVYPGREPWYMKAVLELTDLGFYHFEATNISHFKLVSSALASPGGRGHGLGTRRRKEPDIHCGHQLNVLNSQSALTLQALGAASVTPSVECGLEDLAAIKSALAPLPTSRRPRLTLMAFGFLPMFTARLDHSLYSRKHPVVSSKDERFYWQHDGDMGFLLPARPYSALSEAYKLLQIGFRTWIIDLSRAPSNYRLPATLDQGLSRLVSRLKGSRFNLVTGLE